MTSTIEYDVPQPHVPVAPAAPAPDAGSSWLSWPGVALVWFWGWIEALLVWLQPARFAQLLEYLALDRARRWSVMIATTALLAYALRALWRNVKK